MCVVPLDVKGVHFGGFLPQGREGLKWERDICANSRVQGVRVHGKVRALMLLVYFAGTTKDRNTRHPGPQPPRTETPRTLWSICVLLFGKVHALMPLVLRLGRCDGCC